jgi:uncharacterized protein with GYD domain
MCGQEEPMPKYLLRASYTAEGIKGVVKDGGTKRQAAARSLVESLGGKLEAFYYAFGETDIFAIVELPDNASAASASMTIGGTGAVTGNITVLLTPADLDQAVKKSGQYTAPGH